MNVAETLVQRNSVHGDFFEGAEFGQKIEDMMRDTPGWAIMNAGQKDALRVIVQKMARICYGDPHFSDHWLDIAGYATIIDKKLAKPVAPVQIDTSGPWPTEPNEPNKANLSTAEKLEIAEAFNSDIESGLQNVVKSGCSPAVDLVMGEHGPIPRPVIPV